MIRLVVSCSELIRPGRRIAACRDPHDEEFLDGDNQMPN